MSVQRFDKDMDGSMEPADHGRWVRYDDALSIVRERDELLQALREICSACGLLTIPAADVLHAIEDRARAAIAKIVLAEIDK